MKEEKDKKEKTPPKSVGEVFKLFLSGEQHAALFAASCMATGAENACWKLWERHDPFTAEDQLAARAKKQQTGKWPKLPPYDLKRCPDGRSPYQVVMALCPGISSRVGCAISNHVSRFYRKKRLALVTDRERRPFAKEPRLRIHKSAVRIRRDPQNEAWFQVGVQIMSADAIAWMGMRTTGVSEHTLRWLSEQAAGGAPVCGAVLSLRKKRNKKFWQIALARARYDGEREQTDPVEGRSLLVYAPLEQDEFLKMQVTPVRGRPWVEIVESNDLLRLKRANEEKRRRMGRNYHQSPDSCAHGHGRNRAIQGKLDWAYDRRVNAWIENRSRAIVSFAVRTCCAGIEFEDLCKRDPRGLRLGPFPYFKLLERAGQKAKDAGLKFERFTDLESLINKLTPAAGEGCETEVA